VSVLLNSTYHYNGESDEENRTLEIDYTYEGIYISIEWPVGKGGLGGIRSETFKLSAEESRELARNILERVPDPAILEDNLLAL
jgi:hypothetical protein